MPRKLTYEFVKESFESEGYTLLSKECENSKEKLDYRCQEWHLHSISWNNWKTGYRCQYCNSKSPNDLTIHHIDYNKKNCHPSNLITVCRSCNASANFNRGWHKEWYSAIIKKRYGGSNYAKG